MSIRSACVPCVCSAFEVRGVCWPLVSWNWNCGLTPGLWEPTQVLCRSNNLSSPNSREFEQVNFILKLQVCIWSGVSVHSPLKGSCRRKLNVSLEFTGIDSDFFP